MKPVLILFILILTGRAIPAIPQPALDFSCSTFPRDLSEAALITRYGATNVKSAGVIGFDDGPQDGEVVFADQPDAKVEIVWMDAKSKSKPAWIRIQGERSSWKLPNGLALGNSLKIIEQINRKPFRLAAFSTEGEGKVLSWAGGRLEVAKNPTCTIKYYVQPRWNASDDPLAMRQLVSGGGFSSGHPAMQKLDPHLRVVIIDYQ